MNKPKLVAEIGCNHGGDFDTAIKMIGILTDFCGVEYIKFQKRCPRECLTTDEYNAPHPVPGNAYGTTYGAHREALEFTWDQHRRLMEECYRKGAKYGCSVWDLTSLRQIVELKPDFIKIPSAHCTNMKMHQELLESDYEGMIHVSTGMTTNGEIQNLIQYYRDNGRNNDLALYHCVSVYPVTFENACLMRVEILREDEGSIIGGIGYSGHHKGIALDIAAYALGAEWIERHFTLDRTTKGTDHAASLEPDGMRRLKRDLDACHQAMGLKDGILDCELPAMRKLRWDRHKQSQ